EILATALIFDDDFAARRDVVLLDLLRLRRRVDELERHVALEPLVALDAALDFAADVGGWIDERDELDRIRHRRQQLAARIGERVAVAGGPVGFDLEARRHPAERDED